MTINTLGTEMLLTFITKTYNMKRYYIRNCRKCKIAFALKSEEEHTECPYCRNNPKKNA
jgi:hypothetical protein